MNDLEREVRKKRLGEANVNQGSRLVWKDRIGRVQVPRRCCAANELSKGAGLFPRLAVVFKAAIVPWKTGGVRRSRGSWLSARRLLDNGMWRRSLARVRLLNVWVLVLFIHIGSLTTPASADEYRFTG